MDALGNRTQALEALPRPGTGQTVLGSSNPAVDYYRGMWTADGDLVTSPDPDAALRVAFLGDEATLTLGTGPEYGICDVYVNGSLWRSFDNYATSAGEDVISLPLGGEGPHVLEIRNRSDKNRASPGYRVAFKQLVTESLYDLHTIQYGYDGLSRLLNADYLPGMNTGAAAFRSYDYGYDLAGNRLYETVTLDGTPTTTNYTYNAANQITSGGVMYDAAGRMTNGGTNAYTWDRADRLLSMGGVANTYNGLGQRVSQTVNEIVTEYLLDVQPGLWTVIAQTAQGNTTRYVHGPRGIQAHQNSAGTWGWMAQDGLGNVRLETGTVLDVVGMQHFAPYGVSFGEQAALELPFGFTGEQTDINDLVYLRARQYVPAMGVFSTKDPYEGLVQDIMSINGYSYVENNPANNTDPSGRICIPCVVAALAGLAFLASGCTDTEHPSGGAPESSGDNGGDTRGASDNGGSEGGGDCQEAMSEERILQSVVDVTITTATTLEKCTTDDRQAWHGLGTYIGGDQLITHSHWEFQKNPERYQVCGIYIYDSKGEPVTNFPWTAGSIESAGVSSGQSIINMPNAPTQLQRIPIASNASNIFASTGCNEYTIRMAKFVEPTRSGSPIQVVNAGIRRDATFEAHSGFVDVDYGFYLFGVSLESGDSGSPVIGGHEIIGLYAGGGSGAYANNYAAWASSTL